MDPMRTVSGRMRGTADALGNSVEQVAGFVGHRNPHSRHTSGVCLHPYQLTQDVYIAMTRSQRRQMVDCPWLRDAPLHGPSIQREGQAMAEAICSPFGSADGRTFPHAGGPIKKIATPLPSSGISSDERNPPATQAAAQSVCNASRTVPPTTSARYGAELPAQPDRRRGRYTTFRQGERGGLDDGRGRCL